MTSAGMMGPGGSYGSLDMRSDQYRRSGSWSAGETASSIGYSDDGISCPPATPVLGDLRSVAEHIRRYSQPFMAWGMCLTGLLAWGAVGPLYGCFPEDVREVPFRVGLWRNALALVPFAAFAGVKWARQGIGAEHRAYVTNPWNWPVLLLPGAVCPAPVVAFGQRGRLLSHPCARSAVRCGWLGAWYPTPRAWIRPLPPPFPESY